MNRATIIVLAITTLSCVAHAETYFISVDGKPTNDGSRDKPWPSVQFALEKVKGGNTFVFRPGVYRGPIQIPDAYAGTEQAPTVIRSEEKWKAAIVGSAGHGIYVGDHCHWTIIDGFEVLGARADGVKCNADHCIIRNCWVHNNVSMGIAAHHTKNSTIENNLIEFNGCHIQFDHGIYADGEGLVVHGNIIRHNAGFGIHLYPAIENARVYQNLVYGQEHHAALLLVCPKNGGVNQVFQNTLVGKTLALEIWNGNNTVIENNILTSETGDPIALLHGTKKVNADYNLCWPKSAHEETHGVSADPKFLNPAHGIFWLASDSPALGKGSAVHALATDFWGRQSPRDAAPDLGALAYVAWLVDPKSRAEWYHGWAYGYPPQGPSDVPDLWTIPPAVAAKPK